MKAIVTGHSRGLGAAVAAALMTRGIPVLALARQGNPALAAAHGGLLTEVAIDLADAAAAARWLASGALAGWLADATSALLVNNAGVVSPVAPPGSQGADAIARAVSLNVSAPLVLSDAFVAATGHLADRRILHVSSGAARAAYAGWSVYCATKAALDHHARAVLEDALPGLRICALAPGVVDTDMQTTLRASDPAAFPALPRFEALKREGKLTSPAECAARLVAHALSPAFGDPPVADLRELPAA
jgi:NAD(P)-dependent dehydrogenase (short-subunit alcohol dehydrogenase family)